MSDTATEQFESGRAEAFARMAEKIDNGEAAANSFKEEPFGSSGVEAGQDYKPMTPAIPVEPVKFDDAPAVPHPGENPVATEINYPEVDTGKPKPANETVSAEQAAADLSRYRDGISETLEAQRSGIAIDQLRSGTLDQPQAIGNHTQDRWDKRCQNSDLSQPPLTQE